MKHSIHLKNYLLLVLTLFSLNIFSQVTREVPLNLLQGDEYLGYYNYTSTGNTLRAAHNNMNACSVLLSSSAPLTEIPAGATVVKAYLYWAGSGSIPDYTVTFQSQTVTASRTYQGTLDDPAIGFALDFFSGVADVTSIVALNGNTYYTFSNLTVNTGIDDYCDTQTVLKGWSLIVIYEDLTLTYQKKINIYEGFDLNNNSTSSFTLSGLKIPYSNPTGKVTGLFWEGDDTLQGDTTNPEQLRFEGVPLTNGTINPPEGAFNGTIDTENFQSTTAYGVDLDSYDISDLLTPGGTSVNLEVQSAQDLVITSAIVMAADVYIPQLELNKSSTTTRTPVYPGDIITYTIDLANTSTIEQAVGVSLTDILPAGVEYVPNTIERTYWISQLSPVQYFTKNIGTTSFDPPGTTQIYEVTTADVPSGAILASYAMRVTGTSYYVNELSLSAVYPGGTAYEFATGTLPQTSPTSFDVTRGPLAVDPNSGIPAIGSYKFIWGDNIRSVGWFDNNITRAEFTIGYQTVTRQQVTDNLGTIQDLIASTEGLSLQSGESIRVTFDVVVYDPLDYGVTELINNVQTEALNYTPPLLATNTVPVVTLSDLELSKSISNATPELFEEVTFTIEVTNNGPRGNKGISIKDYLPADVQYISSTPSVGTTSISGKTLTWDLGNGVLPSGATETLTIVAKVLKCGVMVNDAEIFTADRTDPDSVPGNGK